MLPASHNRAYQDLKNLLIELKRSLGIEVIELGQVNRQFQDLARWYEQNIVRLQDQTLDRTVASRWQSVQTEIKREFKLLTTDILFLASARQNSTQSKRLQSIGDRIDKLIGYCQIMLG